MPSSPANFYNYCHHLLICVMLSVVVTASARHHHNPKTIRTTYRTITAAAAMSSNTDKIPTTTTSVAKSLTPPTIANYEKHDQWLTDAKKIINTAERKLLNDWTTSQIPLKLQNYANRLNFLQRSSIENALLKETEDLPRAGMSGAPDEAHFLCLLLELLDAKRVVEVGVFRGMTTLTLALCLKKLREKEEEGHLRRVIGLDISEEFAATGMKYWREGGVDDIIDFRVGDATKLLDDMIRNGESGSADLCFIDANKTGYNDYYERCLELTRSGGLIVIDNTLWGGRVSLPDGVLEMIAEGGEVVRDCEGWSRELAEDTLAIKRLIDKIAGDERVDHVSFLTIADGVVICKKK